jgi:hypothetical protein
VSTCFVSPNKMDQYYCNVLPSVQVARSYSRYILRLEFGVCSVCATPIMHVRTAGAWLSSDRARRTPAFPPSHVLTLGPVWFQPQFAKLNFGSHKLFGLCLVFATLVVCHTSLIIWPTCHRVNFLDNSCQSLAFNFLATLFVSATLL